MDLGFSRVGLALVGSVRIEVSVGSLRWSSREELRVGGWAWEWGWRLPSGSAESWNPLGGNKVSLVPRVVATRSALEKRGGGLCPH